MSRKFAVINNNIVTSIMDLDDDSINDIIKQNDMVIDVEDELVTPVVGWVLYGNKIISTNSISMEEIVRGKIKNARLFGAALISEAADRIGALNIISGKTEAQVSEVINILLPIRILLESGALNTARTQLNTIRSSLPLVLSPQIDWALDKITQYLGY
jgi:hypothetical protein